MDPVGYVIGGFVVYASSALGVWLARAYRGEIDGYERIIEWLARIALVAIWTSLGWLMTGSFAVSLVLFAGSAIASLYIKVAKHIVFIVLSAAYILAAVFTTAPFSVAILLFVFGALTTSLASRDRPVKRVLIRRLPFFILVLFGYLLSFMV